MVSKKFGEFMSEHRFIKACRREETDCTPVWFMRQAGRYLHEYMAVRADHSFLEISRSPELTKEVTLQPLRAFDLDAAIIFADIMTPFEGIDIDFDIEAGAGPVITEPVQTLADLERMKPFDASKVDFLFEAIGQVVAELDGQAPLIGFAGAPFTLACYLIQGRSSREFGKARHIMYTQPELWDGVMTRLSSMVVEYLERQVQAGVAAVQVFDSWVGLLSPYDYKTKVAPYMKGIFDALAGTGVPRIHFGTGTTGLFELMRDAGADVIGLDWRISLDEGWRRVGYDRAVQGNLDPVLLLSDMETVKTQMQRILDEAAGRPGHIFNLGHGIIRTTPREHVAELAKAVHEASKR